MNKGLTPLEVSKELKDFVLEFVKNSLDRRFICGSFDLIENELKDKEKKDKALEIIKEKRVEVGLVMICNTYQDYEKLHINNHVGMQKLTQEEYDLLKKV